MNIVILDGWTANPGDLDWNELESLGNLIVYDRTPKDKIVERCSKAQIIFTNKTPLDSEALHSLSELRYIGVLATGYNVVDIAAANKLGITVCNVPSYSTMSVAQNVFALILEITNEVAHYTNEVKAGKWTECEDFSYTNTPLIELSGKQIGIIGYGSIGKKVGEIANAFGMQVVAYTSKSEDEIFPAVKSDLDTLFKTSDIITLHCPLTPETHHLINMKSLSLMKKESIVINTGRGALIDEKALANALNEGKIAGAGVDVLSEEPPLPSNPLLTAPNIKITPHISWATKESRKRLLEISVSNLKNYLAGNPQNVIK